MAWQQSRPESHWKFMDDFKNQFTEKRATSATDLEKAIKEVWVKEITAEYCRKLIQSILNASMTSSNVLNNWAFLNAKIHFLYYYTTMVVIYRNYMVYKRNQFLLDHIQIKTHILRKIWGGPYYFGHDCITKWKKNILIG